MKNLTVRIRLLLPARVKRRDSAAQVFERDRVEVCFAHQSHQ